jgi:hypothetical protein
MFELLSKVFGRTPPRRDSVAFDAQSVVRSLADGRQESVAWEELREVRIVTTNAGPFACDVFWLLIGVTGGCAVPSEAEGMPELLTRLQQLPDFDNLAVVTAMGCAEEASFVAWKAAPERVECIRR